MSVAEAGFAGGVSAGELMVESAKQCGIDIQLVREPNDGYWSNVWNVKGWCNSYWGGRPTQDVMYQAAYTKETNWNETAWKDTEAAVKFNELVIMARSETNNDKLISLGYLSLCCRCWRSVITPSFICLATICS